jgi:4-amino-4-deoxy-L-arabinose transferase-like glycosyltransferase
LATNSETQKDTKRKDSFFIIDTRSKLFNILLILLCFLFLGIVRLVGNQPISGDEPAYLLMDYSLVHNGTFNLSKAYTDKDYLSFSPGASSIQGSPAPGTKAPAKDYSVHGIGLPLFLSPGFALAPVVLTSKPIAAADGATVMMLLLATLVIVLTWVWTKQITKNRKVAYIASGLLAITYFFSGLAGHFYPDMLTSALLVLAMILVERYYSKLIVQVVLGFILGFMVLVHIKTLALVIPVLLVLTYVLWTNKRKIPWPTLSIVAVFVAYYLITSHQWFGYWIAPTGNGAGGSTFGDNPLMSISAMLFDSFRGLLVYNPILIFIFLGFPLWFKNNRRALIMTISVTILYFIGLSLYFQYNGGDAPLGRYLIDILPLYIPALAFAIEALKKPWQKFLVCIAAVVTFLITIDATNKKFPLVDPGATANLQRSPLFIQIQQHTGIALDHFLPRTSQYLFYHTVFIDKHGLLKIIVCWLVVLAFIIYGIYLSRSKNKPRHSTPI